MRLVCVLFLAACGAPPVVSREVIACPEPATVPSPDPIEAPPDDRTVVLDGCPEVTPEMTARMNQYLNTRSAYVTWIADDGRSLVVLTRFADTAQVHLLDHPMGDRRQLTFFEEPVRDAEPIPSDPNGLLYLSDIGGNEDNQIYRLDRRTGRATLLTDGRSRHERWILSHDGARMAFNNNARNGRDVDVYVADGADVASARRVTELEGNYVPLDFSRDGQRLLVMHYVSINDTRLYVVDLRTNELRRVTPEAPVAAYRTARFDQSGNRLYVTTDRDGEFAELYEVDLAHPESVWRPLSRDVPWNVEEVELSHDGRTLAFTANVDGYSELRLLDTRTRRVTVVSSIPRGGIVGMTFARAAPVLAMTLSGATRTGDAYTYDLRTRRLVRWTDSEVGGLDPGTFIEPTLFRYPTFDGREIPAFYYRPRGEGPFPVLVSIHGGPEAQARPGFSPFLQYLAVESGVAILVPNVRGSDGYGKSYLMLDNGTLREGSVRDIGALLDWIATRPELARDRVAVFGGSYGGYMVLASLVHFGDRLRAGIDVVGISNFVSFLENTRDYRQDLRRVEYGDERDPEMRAHLASISPLHRASEIRSGLLVAQGANDPRVPMSEAEQIVRTVRENEHPVCYMLARNEGHGFRRKENIDLFNALAATFIDAQLRAR